jgi:hypothetical protein
VREQHLVPKRVVQGVHLRVAATDSGRHRFSLRTLRALFAVARRFGVTLFAAAPALANPTIDEALTDARRGMAYDSTAPVISGGTAPYTFTLNEASPLLSGITAPQVAAANRFGTAQIQNVGTRARLLHLGHDPCSIQLDLGANIRWERIDGAKDETAAPAEPPTAKAAEMLKGRGGCDRELGVWVAGNLDFGFLRPSTAIDRSDFKSSGLTLGADTKVGKGLVLGAALGYGRDQSDVGPAESSSSAQAASATFYGSYQAFKSVFVDFALGNSNLAFDSTRWQNNSEPVSSRSGSQLFGSVGLSGLLQSGSLKLAPYGRFDRVRSQLDGYIESGSSAYALSYGSSGASENAVAAGLFASNTIRLGRTILEPSLRIEQRWLYGSPIDQSLAYADLPSTQYLLVYDGASDSQTLGGVGLLLRLRRAMSLGLEYTYAGTASTAPSETVRAVMRAPF